MGDRFIWDQTDAHESYYNFQTNVSMRDLQLLHFVRTWAILWLWHWPYQYSIIYFISSHHATLVSSQVTSMYLSRRVDMQPWPYLAQVCPKRSRLWLPSCMWRCCQSELAFAWSYSLLGYTRWQPLKIFGKTLNEGNVLSIQLSSCVRVCSAVHIK